MVLHKGKLKEGFPRPECEKHFHDHDETWVILKGKGNSYWLDDDGKREEFALEAGVIKVSPIIQDVVPIQDAMQIYDRLRDAPDSVFGTVFSWE